MISLRNVTAMGLLIALLAGSAWAQPAPDTVRGPAAEPPVAIENIRARTGTDLSGQWHYIVDRSRLGIRKRGMQRNFPQDRTATNHPLLEYDWDTSPLMAVPGDWNSQVTAIRCWNTTGTPRR